MELTLTKRSTKSLKETEYPIKPSDKELKLMTWEGLRSAEDNTTSHNELGPGFYTSKYLLLYNVYSHFI